MLPEQLWSVLRRYVGAGRGHHHRRDGRVRRPGRQGAAPYHSSVTLNVQSPPATGYGDVQHAAVLQAVPVIAARLTSADAASDAVERTPAVRWQSFTVSVTVDAQQHRARASPSRRSTRTSSSRRSTSLVTRITKYPADIGLAAWSSRAAAARSRRARRADQEGRARRHRGPGRRSRDRRRSLALGLARLRQYRDLKNRLETTRGLKTLVELPEPHEPGAGREDEFVLLAAEIRADILSRRASSFAVVSPRPERPAASPPPSWRAVWRSPATGSCSSTPTCARRASRVLSPRSTPRRWRRSPAWAGCRPRRPTCPTSSSCAAWRCPRSSSTSACTAPGRCAWSPARSRRSSARRATPTSCSSSTARRPRAAPRPAPCSRPSTRPSSSRPARLARRRTPKRSAQLADLIDTPRHRDPRRGGRAQEGLQPATGADPERSVTRALPGASSFSTRRGSSGVLSRACSPWPTSCGSSATAARLVAWSQSLADEWTSRGLGDAVVLDATP